MHSYRADAKDVAALQAKLLADLCAAAAHKDPGRAVALTDLATRVLNELIALAADEHVGPELVQ